MTAPYPRTTFPSDNETVNSNQVSLRHPKSFTYRCFLPDLTGFVNLCCTGPNLQHHLFHPDLKKMSPQIGFRSCSSGLQVQGTANSPPSTAITSKQFILIKGNPSPLEPLKYFHSLAECNCLWSNL